MLNIDITLNPSKQCIALFVIILCLSELAIFLTPIPIVLKMMLIVAVIIYGIDVVKKYGLLVSDNSILKMKSIDETKWRLETKQKVWVGELKGESTVTRMLCILRFCNIDDKKTQTCLVFNDAVSSQLYKKLFIQLKNT